jgi:hypothetical protein
MIMKQEPPIERSEAPRDAPVFRSSPLGGSPARGRALRCCFGLEYCPQTRVFFNDVRLGNRPHT